MSDEPAATLIRLDVDGVPTWKPDGDGDGRRQRNYDDSPSYYDISLLKAPLWRWEIAWYFFLGGLSAGSFVLSRLGEIVGGKKHRDLTRAATWISAAAAIPCAPLLIHDLGDPKRFHHMLRVFKLSSPMSVGSWTLAGYTSMVCLAAIRELVKDRADIGRKDEVASTTAGITMDRAVMMSTDVVGIPLALLLSGYTGVLLSTTANPLWSRNQWIGPMFSASAVHAAASATRLALAAGSRPDSPSTQALTRIDQTATVVEGVAVVGYLIAAGELAKPLIRGNYAKLFLGGAIALGLFAPTLIERLPAPRKAKRWLTIAGCVAGLIGGLALRWAMVYAGHESANDPEQARLSSRKKMEKSGVSIPE